MTGMLVALDLPVADNAVALASLLLPHSSGFKVGLELLMGPDPHIVERVVELGLPVFVDAKLHDIPATVERAGQQLGRRGARWVTVHLAGGVEMVKAASSGLAAGSNDVAGVLGVTVLTSLSSPDLGSVGVNRTVPEQVRLLGDIAVSGDAEGLICSVHEVPVVNASYPGLTTVTPGIRASGDPADDQRRVATIDDARAAAPDYVVVGRAILRASDPVAVAAQFAEELAATMN